MHSLNPPRVAWIYNLELKLFGITQDDGNVVIPAEWWVGKYRVWLDLPCAFAYCIFLYQSLAYACYLVLAG